MKTLWFCLFILFSAPLFSQSCKADDILEFWLTEEGKAIVEK